jgi:hypothetical protein
VDDEASGKVKAGGDARLSGRAAHAGMDFGNGADTPRAASVRRRWITPSNATAAEHAPRWQRWTIASTARVVMSAEEDLDARVGG